MRTVRLAAAVFNIPTMMNRYYWDITLMVNGVQIFTELWIYFSSAHHHSGLTL